MGLYADQEFVHVPAQKAGVRNGTHLVLASRPGTTAGSLVIRLEMVAAYSRRGVGQIDLFVIGCPRWSINGEQATIDVIEGAVQRGPRRPAQKMEAR